jgi:RING finger protein 113A
MHDRGDYQAGWQIDAEWERKKKAEAEAAARADAWAEAGEGVKTGGEKEEGDGKGGEDGGLPFACLSCRAAWTRASRPVVTPCRHFFCTPCALAVAAVTCPACGRPTGGTFNAASAIEARLKEAGDGGGGDGGSGERGGGEEEEDKGGWGPA